MNYSSFGFSQIQFPRNFPCHMIASCSGYFSRISRHQDRFCSFAGIMDDLIIMGLAPLVKGRGNRPRRLNVTARVLYRSDHQTVNLGDSLRCYNQPPPYIDIVADKRK